MELEWEAPAVDEIEVSVFGRGCGESILVHYGNGEWVVVDSFNVDKRPIPLLYLEAIGHAPAAIKLVVATHWHDDHIRGLADVYRSAISAKIAVPAAMLSDEFLAFASHFTGAPVGGLTSGVKEFVSILEEMDGRGFAGVELGQAWQTLLRHPAGALAHGSAIEFEAMSPSSYDVLTFLRSIAGYTIPSNVAVRATPYDRNDVSCALHIRFGDQAVALGADLENVSEARSGWKGVFAAQQFPAVRASLLKVPHHGSRTGHHDDIWERLCAPNPVTTLTPWARGSGRLPTRDDVIRLRERSGDCYSASMTVTSGDRHRLAAVNSVLKRTNSRIRRVNMALGHVRHRWNGTGWDTKLFGAAVPLKNVAA